MHVAFTGVDLNYETTGEGEPLLWLHGFMGADSDWRYIFNEPPAGFRLIAPGPAWAWRVHQSFWRVLIPAGRT